MKKSKSILAGAFMALAGMFFTGGIICLSK